MELIYIQWKEDWFTGSESPPPKVCMSVSLCFSYTRKTKCLLIFCFQKYKWQNLNTSYQSREKSLEVHSIPDITKQTTISLFFRPESGHRQIFCSLLLGHLPFNSLFSVWITTHRINIQNLQLSVLACLLQMISFEWNRLKPKWVIKKSINLLTHKSSSVMCPRMVKGSTLGKMRVTLILLPQPYVDKYSLGKKPDVEIQMLVLMPILRVHAVEEMGWQSEHPISFFQALLPTYFSSYAEHLIFLCLIFSFTIACLNSTDGNYHIQALTTFTF